MRSFLERGAARVRYPWRTAVGLGIVVVAALLAQVTLGAPWSLGDRRGIDAVSQAEARFRPLRPLLPPARVVGYLSDAASADGREEFRRYIMAQYALAPVIVLDNTEPDLVVGDFSCRDCPRAVDGFHQVWDGGDGVVLLSRTPR